MQMIAALWRQFALALVVFIVLVALWEWVSRTGLLPSIILPPASKVAAGLVTLATAPWFPPHVQATAIETLLGFATGAVASISLASILYHLKLVRRVVYPYIILFQLTPAIVLAPVYMIWFGFGLESKVMVSATTAFFVILLATMAGLDAVEENAVSLLRSLGASRRQIFTMLVFPNALPYVFSGLRTATSLALIGALVAEFITSQVGLGTLLTQFGFGLQQDMVFATVLVVAGLGVVSYALVELLQRRIVWWRY
jgi:NitT/TauT family transport system permease protein